ncbi:ABC transporter permease [Brevibacillus borstelensis]|uniref:ABC transporter permease n=1 Tax=Brevibacillus borstelensis TaxID=45462 RepID=UPI0029CAB596|nr:ABC transporter permease [Brevibacillus borstelensis]
MWRFFRSELLKLRKSPIWLLVFVSPALSTIFGLGMRITPEMEEMAWGMTYTMMAAPHGLLFLPLLTGVLSAFVCRYEHVGGGWKQMLALPVSRGTVYVVKFVWVMGLLLLTQCLLLAGLLAVGTVKGYSAAVPWDILVSSLVGGWVACMPLAALQLAVSVAWSSFAAPMAVSAIEHPAGQLREIWPVVPVGAANDCHALGGATSRTWGVGRAARNAVHRHFGQLHRVFPVRIRLFSA